MTATEWVDVDPGAQPALGYTPAASDDQLALLRWADANPIDRPRLPMTKDGNRYAPETFPDGTKGKATTRVTTFSSATDDGGGLVRWRNRIIAKGATIIGPPKADTVEAHDDWIGRCLHAGGEKLGADVGTALHTAVEHHVGGTGHRPPAPWDADVDAFATMVAAHQLEVVLAEASVFVPVGGNLIGTVDLYVRGPWGDDLRVVDLKTGGSYEHIGYAAQLACYARATHRWTADGWEALPPIDATTAYIAHLPAGSGTCELVAVDLAAAAPLVDLAAAAREVRKVAMVRALFSPVEAPPSLPFADEQPAEAEQPADAATIHEQRTAWVVDRILAVRAIGGERLDGLRRAWMLQADHIARQPPWTPEELEAVHELVSGAEDSWTGLGPQAPAPEPEPAPEPPAPPALLEVADDGTMAAEGDVEGLRAALRQIRAEHVDRFERIRRWKTDAAGQQRPWDTPDGLTSRQWHCARAAVTLARCCWDAKGGETEHRVRAVLAMAIGDDLQPTWTTGAVIGSLTISQAEEVCRTAEAYAAKDATVTRIVKAMVGQTAA